MLSSLYMYFPVYMTAFFKHHYVQGRKSSYRFHWSVTQSPDLIQSSYIHGSGNALPGLPLQSGKLFIRLQFILRLVREVHQQLLYLC